MRPPSHSFVCLLPLTRLSPAPVHRTSVTVQGPTFRALPWPPANGGRHAVPGASGCPEATDPMRFRGLSVFGLSGRRSTVQQSRRDHMPVAGARLGPATGRDLKSGMKLVHVELPRMKRLLPLRLVVDERARDSASGLLRCVESHFGELSRISLPGFLDNPSPNADRVPASPRSTLAQSFILSMC